VKLWLVALAVVVLLVVILVVAGYTLPVKHRAVVQGLIAAPPERVYALITDVAAFPSWRTGVRSVEELPSPDGKRRWREVSGNGTIPFVVDSADPPGRLVTRIDSKSLPFGGTWTFEIRPAPDGKASLDIIEDGEIYNPIFRLVSRLFIGYDGTMKQYVSDVQRKLK